MKMKVDVVKSGEGVEGGLVMVLAICGRVC